LRAADPVDAILEFARSHGVGHLVVGRSLQPTWKQILGRAVPMRLIREAHGLDVHVVAQEGEEEGGV
jgi:two-component system sensor histidine kinase KdpD